MELDEIASSPPLYSPVCKRTPAHRLRSKRSRLRLQNKERESDTDISLEKERDGSGENIICEKLDTEIKEGSECTNKANSLKGVRKHGKMEEKDCEKKKEKRMSAEREKNQDRPIGIGTVGKISKPSQELENDRKRKEHCVLNCSASQSDNKLSVVSSEENQNVHFSQEKINVKEESHLGSAVSIQTSSEAVQMTDKSEQMLEQTNHLRKDSNMGYDDRTDIKQSGILDSCTLVEGLPFPVEYYIRTTRRMAASHSSVDLDAVIYSQLTGGRGRRRLSQSQTSCRGHITPERSICRSTDQTRRGGKGQRGRRGRPRKSCAKAALDAASDSQADSESFMESKCTSHTESPSQSELVFGRLEAESQPIQSLGPTVSLKPSPEQGDTQDFKHLPDSQLCFDTQLLPDSNLYPIFRRKQGQTGRESQTGTNKYEVYIFFFFFVFYRIGF